MIVPCGHSKSNAKNALPCNNNGTGYIYLHWYEKRSLISTNPQRNILQIPLLFLQPGAQLFKGKNLLKCCKCAQHKVWYINRESLWHVTYDIDVLHSVFLLIPNDQNFQKSGEWILCFTQINRNQCITGKLKTNTRLRNGHQICQYWLC